MENSVGRTSWRISAQLAGLWYTFFLAFGVFELLVDARFSVPGDAAESAARILAGDLLFRLGIVSSLAGQVCFVFLGLAFYKLFRSVGKDQARTLLSLVIASVPIAFLNMLNKLAPLLLLGDSAFLKAFPPGQIQALAMVFIELQKYGTVIAGVFWGLWLLPLGTLVRRSGWFPGVFGILLLIGGACYLLDSLLALVLPGLREGVSPILNMILTAGEVPFILWLLIRGPRSRVRDEGSLEPVK
jgi:hypothetical protein